MFICTEMHYNKDKKGIGGNMKKIKWLELFGFKDEDLRDKIPECYKGISKEEWDAQEAAVRKEFEEMQENSKDDDDDSLEDLLAFMEKHRDFFYMKELMEKESMRRLLDSVDVRRKKRRKRLKKMPD